jgi:hypothetical protein
VDPLSKTLEPPHQRPRRGPERQRRRGVRPSASPFAGAARPVRRRGVVLLIAVVCIAAASVIFVSVLRLAAAERRRGDAEAWQVQAAWLAESAVERAVARLADDPQYQGETWSLSPDDLGTRHSAIVVVHVETTPEREQRRLIRVEADYPDHPHRRARESKQITVQVKQ